MSYDICLKDQITGETLELDEAHHMRGGTFTYAVGGMREAPPTRICNSCGRSEEESPFLKDHRYRKCAACANDVRNAGARLPAKLCGRCGVTRLGSEFPRPRDRICRVCVSKRITAHQKASLKVRAYMQAYSLKRLYGLDPGEYEAMLHQQGGVCAVCQKPPRGKYRLRVDHDHATGAVRGLLCNPCNSGMGRLGDDPERLRVAAAYIELAAVR